MCFESLTDEKEASKPVATVLRNEFRHAVRQGLVAAALVVVVLVAGQTRPWIVGVSTAGALVLGVALHQTVLLVGLGVMRLFDTEEPEPTAPDTA